MRALGLRWMLGAALLFAVGIVNAQVDVLTGETNSKSESASKTETSVEGMIVKVDSKPIPFTTQYETSRTVGAGRLVKVQAGKAGEIRTSYRIQMVNGKVVSKEKVGVERIEPVHEKFLVGKAGYAASRGAYTRGKVLVMNASAYDPSAGRGSRATFRTKTGERAQFGVVAVDPRVIPLGTMVYVEGYGLALACDICSAIKGNRIDLCLPTRAECMQFGRRKVVVHILK